MGRFDNFKFTVQDKKKLRVIVDTDAACEADDPFAIVHALLTPRFHVKGIIAELFANDSSGESVDQSYEVIQKLLGLMKITDVPVLRGPYRKLPTEQSVLYSEGADFIRMAVGNLTCLMILMQPKRCSNPRWNFGSFQWKPIVPCSLDMRSYSRRCVHVEKSEVIYLSR